MDFSIPFRQSSMLGQHLIRLSSVLSNPSFYFTVPTEETEESKSGKQEVGQNWCQVKNNEYGQRQCRGCDEICSLVRWGEVQRRRDPAYEGRSQTRMLHSNYRELDMCASRSGCDTCRTIRRAFLLAQITGHDAQELENPDQQWPVYVALNLSNSGGNLSLSIESPDTTLFEAAVQLRRDKPSLACDATRGGKRVRPDFEELKKVVQDCHENHECSWRHRWSDQNPSWLLEILPENHVRVVKRPESPVDYVVLSYSWGDPATMPTEEWARIKAAATKSKDGIPILERLQPFSRHALPETMQDAIAITEALEFRYIWIDSVCIPKGTNWDVEAGLMHEVYGNAAFTLVASACTKATDRLLQDRLAWKHRSKGCKLRGMWLHDDHASLDKVRLGSPVAQRGWTLQEERLSPRILYWAGQRWHWSCPERQVAELDYPPSPVSQDVTMSLPQSFLEVCRTGEEQQLDNEWLDIVEAYTRRDFAYAKDRFLAISGLAVRYYNAKIESSEHLGTEQYLAGLWRDNLARHLTWSVEEAAQPDQSLQHIAPSWSWASLPLKTVTRTKHAFKQSEHFQFCGSFGVATTADPSREWARVVEEQGRIIKVVEVQGRIRPFISEGSQKVHWKEVERKQGDRTSFNFSVLPGRSLYARNLEDGRVVSKEAHRGEIVGQLDYLPTRDGYTEKTGLGVCLPERVEKDLICLELGESAMLLLQPMPEWPGAYRRVGVCIGYANRKGFFYGCEAKRLLLC